MATTLPVRQVYVRVGRGERLPNAESLVARFGEVGALEAPGDGRHTVHMCRRRRDSAHPHPDSPSDSAYVHFASASEAAAAVKQLDGTKLDDATLQVALNTKTHRVLWIRELYISAATISAALGGERQVRDNLEDGLKKEFREFGPLDAVRTRRGRPVGFFDVELVFQHKEDACKALAAKQGAPYRIDFEWRREEDGSRGGGADRRGQRPHPQRREASSPYHRDRQERHRPAGDHGDDNGGRYSDEDDPLRGDGGGGGGSGGSDDEYDQGDGDSHHRRNHRQRQHGQTDSCRSPSPSPLTPRSPSRRRRQSHSRSCSPPPDARLGDIKRVRVDLQPSATASPSVTSTTTTSTSTAEAASAAQTIALLQRQLQAAQCAIASEIIHAGGTWLQEEFKIGQLLERLNARFVALHLPQWSSNDATFKQWFDEVVKPIATPVAWVVRR